MASLNKCCFIGNMTKEPESRFTQSGTQVVSFSIAVNEKYKDKEVVEYIDVTAWAKLGEIIANFGTRGMQVYVEGRWTTDKFTDKEGKERRTVKLTADKFLMLGSKGGKGEGGNKGQGGGGQQSYEEPPDMDGFDVPF